MGPLHYNLLFFVYLRALYRIVNAFVAKKLKSEKAKKGRKRDSRESPACPKFAKFLTFYLPGTQQTGSVEGHVQVGSGSDPHI
jgi:hypothetical protein